MNLRAVVAVGLGLFVGAVAPDASAWQEAHQAGDDLTVRVEADGSAAVRDVVKWRVVRGPVKQLDLVNVDPSALLDSAVTITAEDGRTTTGHLVRVDEKTVRILVDQPKAVMRGTFAFEARWKVDLVATHAIAFDGLSWRLSWSAPVASDGIDASRTVFDLPGAPEEPRPILADTGAVDDTAVASVQREDGRDALELVRPHVARGESASWTVRVDPRALSKIHDPAARPAPVPPTPEAVEGDRVHAIGVFLVLVALALAFGTLVAHKTSAFGAACAAAGASARSLIPLPTVLRVALAGCAFSGAVALQAMERPIEGAALAALAALLAALRSPSVKSTVRGPGRWLAIRPDEAFGGGGAARGHWMDIGCAQGRVAAAVGALLVCAIGAASRRLTSEAPWLVAIDAMAFVPLLVTGRAVQLPPGSEGTGAPWLQRVFDRLRQTATLRTVPWARLTVDGSKLDELRLLVLPRAAMPGVAGIEVGLGWFRTPVGWVSSPEVLVRFLDGSPAAARIAQSGPSRRTLPGRKPDERVMRAIPRNRTPAGAATLAAALAESMIDRRVTKPAPSAWTLAERRVFVAKAAAPATARAA